MTASHEFDTDTALDRIDDDRYAAQVTDRWGALGPPVNGGYLLGIGVRALQQTLDRPDPLVVSAFYLRPGQVGSAEVTVDLVRPGSRFTTGQASILQGGKETLRVLANFGDLGAHDGRTHVEDDPPDLPSPERCVDLTQGRSFPGLSLVDRIDYRVPVSPGWVTGTPSGKPCAEFWMRFSDGREPDTRCLPSLVDAGWPVVMELGVRGSSTVELTAHVRARPRPGWLACRVRTRYLMDGMHEEDFEIWDSAGTLVAQARQFAVLA